MTKLFSPTTRAVEDNEEMFLKWQCEITGPEFYLQANHQSREKNGVSELKEL